MKNVTEARYQQGKGGQPEEDRDAKRKKDNDDRSERLFKRAGGPEGGSSCSAQIASELMHVGNLELTDEALGEGISGIVYRGK